MTPEIVPRWEWRTFGESFGAAEELLTQGEPSRVEESDETYLLSEEGRKASLLDGGDGKAVQQLSLQVPANRLHLVSVDANGVARLKLRPRYQLDGDHGIARIDAKQLPLEFRQTEDVARKSAQTCVVRRFVFPLGF